MVFVRLALVFVRQALNKSICIMFQSTGQGWRVSGCFKNRVPAWSVLRISRGSINPLGGWRLSRVQLPQNSIGIVNPLDDGSVSARSRAERPQNFARNR